MSNERRQLWSLDDTIKHHKIERALLGGRRSPWSRLSQFVAHAGGIFSSVSKVSSAAVLEYVMSVIAALGAIVSVPTTTSADTVPPAAITEESANDCSDSTAQVNNAFKISPADGHQDFISCIRKAQSVGIQVSDETPLHQPRAAANILFWNSIDKAAHDCGAMQSKIDRWKRVYDYGKDIPGFVTFAYFLYEKFVKRQPKNTTQIHIIVDGQHHPITRESLLALADQISDSLVDVNSASPEQLETLPGITPNHYNAIISGRPYNTKVDLLQRHIIPSSVYENIKDDITAKRV